MQHCPLRALSSLALTGRNLSSENHLAFGQIFGEA